MGIDTWRMRIDAWRMGTSARIAGIDTLTTANDAPAVEANVPTAGAE
jgi:hypothetical protein